MNVGQAFLLVLGVAVGFGALMLRIRTRGGWPIFFFLYGLAITLLLAGFGLFRIAGISA